MIKIMTIIFMILLPIHIQAKSNQWHPLKDVENYSPKDFNLKKNVAYLEIRQYQVDAHNKLKKRSYKTILSLSRTPLKSFGSSQIKRFRKLLPDLSNGGDIRIRKLESSGVGCYYRYNGFLIDSNGKMFSMNTVKDVIGFLGQIDTPAEAQTVLWLNDKVTGKSYRKSPHGYDVIIKYQDEEGDSQAYCKKYTYKASISHKGKITKYQLLYSYKTKQYCMHIDGHLAIKVLAPF